MRQASLLKFSLDMDSGVYLRDEHMIFRDGYIVKLVEGDKVGYGEISPLPAFNEETPLQAFEQAQSILKIWLEGGHLDYREAYPCVAFGLSMAKAEMEDRLPKETPFDSVMLCTGDPDAVIKQLEGINPKIAKEKVGMYEPIRDALTTRTMLEAIPDLYLRLDSNKRWNEKKTAQFVKYFPAEFVDRILFFEEPCNTAKLSIEFARDNNYKLAWDESLREALHAKDETAVAELINCEQTSAIVLKPSMTGSLETCIALIEKVKSAGKEVVISSSFETSFGLSQLSRMAHWLTPNTRPSLDTLRFFVEQLQVKWPEFEAKKYITFDELEVSWQG